MNRETNTPAFTYPLALDVPDQSHLLLVDDDPSCLHLDENPLLYPAADQNLYLAKGAGRNRVEPAVNP